MNILVLENDPQNRDLIERTLRGKSVTLTNVASSNEAWQHLQLGESRFIIADWDASDVRQTQFMQKVRASNLAHAVYILLLAGKLDDGASPAGMDDLIIKPFRPIELKNRVLIAERILSLTSKLAIAHEQLENRAVFDSLTGFMNRAAFLRQAAGELERSRRASLPLSLIALDIDDFKTINDSFGMQMGDEVLQVVSQTIREKSRPYDCIGLWTGDEFMLAIPGVIGPDAEKIAERIIAGVRGIQIEVPNEAPLDLRMSAGIAAIARITPTTEIEPIIQQARGAVTRAKEAGGNQVFMVFL